MHATYSYIIDSILKLRDQNNRLIIIDYGCGSASIINYIPKKKVEKYYGWDVNENSINKAKSDYPGNMYHFSLAKKNVPDFSKSIKNVDLIISIGVMQYLNSKQIDDFVKYSMKTLKKNGFLVISCASNHLIYRFLDIYQFFSPHLYINSRDYLRKLEKAGFRVEFANEKGLIISPILMNFGTLFVDVLDKILYRNEGFLGPLGTGYRRAISGIIEWEYKSPLNYGYTLYIKAKKQ